MNPCLSIIMPVYNEASTVGNVIAAVLAQPEVAELICVNDCSSDNSGKDAGPIGGWRAAPARLPS